MTVNIKRSLMLLIYALLIYSTINIIDGEFFYDYHNIPHSPLIAFYFAPLRFLADIINLFIPVADTFFFRDVLLRPTYLQRSMISTNIIVFGTGVIWTGILVYIYTLISFLQKMSTLKRVCIYVLGVAMVMFIFSELSTNIFGYWFGRYCPLCP